MELFTLLGTSISSSTKISQIVSLPPNVPGDRWKRHFQALGSERQSQRNMQRDISKVSLISTDSGSTSKSRKKITFDKELLRDMKSTDTQVEEFEKWMLGKA